MLGGPWSVRGRICSVLMVPGAFRSVFAVLGGSFIRFSSVPGVSGMYYIWFVASGDLRGFPGDPEQCLECGSWLKLGLLVLFHLWFLFIVFGVFPDEFYMIPSVLQYEGPGGIVLE